MIKYKTLTQEEYDKMEYRNKIKFVEEEINKIVKDRKTSTTEEINNILYDYFIHKKYGNLILFNKNKS